MANKKPLVLYNGIYSQLKDNDNILDKHSNSIALRAESIGKKIITTQWRDEYVAGEWSKPGGSPAPDIGTFTIGGINVQLLTFDGGNTEERMTNSFEINHDIDIDNLNNETYNIEFHVHFMPSDNTSGTVKWFFDYCYIPTNSSPISQTSLELIKTIDIDSQYKHSLVGVDIPKPSSGYNIGDIILFSIRRNPQDLDDTYNNDIILIKCALHVPVDSNGSNSRYIK